MASPITFPYSWNYTYSDITLHAEQPGYDGQEQDWTQNQGPMSRHRLSSRVCRSIGTSSLRVAFFHNGDWQFTFNYSGTAGRWAISSRRVMGCIEDRPS